MCRAGLKPPQGDETLCPAERPGALTNCVTEEHHVAVVDLFFESPTGLWEDGVYSFIVERDGARAVLPIALK